MRTLLAALAIALSPDDGPRPSDRYPVAKPPQALVESLKLSPFYEKYVELRGFPILGSAKASDYAMKEAAYLIDRMLAGRDDVLKAMAEGKTRFVVMAPTELTTDVPEHSDLTPKAYWDRRARGLGATDVRPAVSCGEENLLCLPGDPYSTENILIHEFGHAIHEMGLNRIDKGFDDRLKSAYERAKEEGLWKGKYASVSRNEYWAEGVQSWFDTNREDDHDHNHVNTREELKDYDPRLAKLIAEVFGDGDWRYVRPEDREEKGHLEGFDRSKAGSFAWPAGLRGARRKDSEDEARGRAKDEDGTP